MKILPTDIELCCHVVVANIHGHWALKCMSRCPDQVRKEFIYRGRKYRRLIKNFKRIEEKNFLRIRNLS
ncbi:hypothetical protein TNIN_303572 [Trichonephila inaurata madagascariensis]|uniref:Uncharacterized protein n=1 Tax=Trichonephila inaurata madagascariensis TaxID=2747483 RepID=A0A8X6XNY1_9ARAC|nr:hypothetical protein TNIN_303572 [Trichonephila inaurata madagascariensis]